VRDLIARSSFGTPAAIQIRRRTPPEVAAHIVAASTALAVEKEARRLAISSPYEPSMRVVTTTARDHGDLDMAKSRKTRAKAGKAASKVLRDGRTSKASKTAAGSALSQRAPKPKGR
jgi:hypothetical protein